MKNGGFVTQITIILALVLVAIVGVVWYSASRPSPEVSENNTPLVGGDKDAHGCIGSAGYSWCEIKQKCLRSWEEYCGPDRLDPAFNILSVLRSESRGIFGYATSSTFDWRAEGNKISVIQGLKIIATGAHGSDYSAARKYFEDNGFAVDNQNAAGGPIGGLDAYEKGNTLCALSYALTDTTFFPDRPVQVNSDKQDITVFCGVSGS